MKIKILFLSANPNLDRPLDKAYSSIYEEIKSGDYRDNIILLRPQLATTVDSIIQAINSEKPHIVHFVGHGTEDGEVMLTDESGIYTELLSKEALAHLFETSSNDNMKLVFLNACHSKSIAQTIGHQIDYVIGMNDEIGNKTAVSLAKTFYRSFADGKTIKESFIQATKVKLATEYPDEKHIPEIIVRNDEVEEFGIKKMIINKDENFKQIEQYIVSNELVLATQLLVELTSDLMDNKGLRKEALGHQSNVNAINDEIRKFGKDSEIDIRLKRLKNSLFEFLDVIGDK